ncbi:MAG: sodium:proline symporter [Verrucomicrobiota bacterium]
MHWIDWTFVVATLVLVFGIMLYTRRYLRSVADFMAGGRHAGRYLLANARDTSGFGVATFVAVFEGSYAAGCTWTWWGVLMAPVGLIFGILGFVGYRYRETRALTMAQFFEMRYSRKFRLFTGMLAFLAGILNYGITPAIQARFFVYFLHLPVTVEIGPWPVPTFALIMAAYLLCVVLMVTLGGQISLMVTDCFEGMISMVFYMVIAIGLLSLFSWAQITEVMTNRPPGHSLLNPFDGFAIADFNLGFALMFTVMGIYGTMAFQFGAGFNAAAQTPHEGRMGGILGGWRMFARGAMFFLLVGGAMVFLNHPKFVTQSEPVRQTLSQISNPQLANQTRAAIVLSYMLPVGIKGAFCVIMLLSLFAADASHLHSWGTIFIQDVVLPLRKTHFETKMHIRVLRLAVVLVAVVAFLFSLLFRQTEYIMMWWTITGAVYVSGAGAVIIGGLYWSRGTAPAAWTTMIAGAVLSLGGILYKQFNPAFPLNGQVVAFLVMLVCIVLYVTVSLLTCRQPFNMQQLLHRGQYAVDNGASAPAAAAVAQRKWYNPARILDFDANFTRGDKILASSVFGWGVFWSVAVLIGTIWNLISPWPIQWWKNFWFIYCICLPFLIGVVTTVWFTWGGVRDLRSFFRRLRAEKVDEADDGTVEK